MTQHKRVTATVKMTYHEDADLIGWWNSVPRGSRNAVMKDMMRHYLEQNRGGYRPIIPRNIPQPFDPLRFTQVCDDAAWIKAALLDLPGYVERVIQQVAVSGNGMTTPVRQVSPDRDEAVVRRESRLKKARW